MACISPRPYQPKAQGWKASVTRVLTFRESEHILPWSSDPLTPALYLNNTLFWMLSLFFYLQYSDYCYTHRAFQRRTSVETQEKPQLPLQLAKSQPIRSTPTSSRECHARGKCQCSVIVTCQKAAKIGHWNDHRLCFLWWKIIIEQSHVQFKEQTAEDVNLQSETSGRK